MLAAFATVLVLTALGVGYWTYSLVQGFVHGTTTCLPSGFPSYPGATRTDESYDLNATYPGWTCHLVLESNDEIATVTAFYQNKLNTGAWQATWSDDQVDKVNFQPAGRATPFGTVQVAVNNEQTEITIDTFTATCLPLDFPRYPGARFGGQNENLSGATARCHIAFMSNDRIAVVTAFYERALNTGYWHVDSSSAGTVSWRLVHGKRTDSSGTVMIALTGDRTEIKIFSYP